MREGKILNPEKLFFDEKGSADVQLDCKGCILAPGFIDVQINGEVRAAAPSPVPGGIGWPWLGLRYQNLGNAGQKCW